MIMAKGKTYYWIKLNVGFMTSEKVDFLMSQKDGANYVVLYQMLCLKTINNNGELASKLGEMIIPYDENKIQRDCKFFTIDTVRVALELYKNLGMIYANENNMLQITNFNEMVGQETDYARQKRIQRKNIQVDKVVDIVHIENRDKSLEFRDKIIDIKERDNKDISNIKTLVDYDSEFEILWQQYPNKKGKVSSLKSYIKYRKLGTTFEEVQNGLDSYNYWLKQNNKVMPYIKNGSTWFSGQLWTDDNTVIVQQQKSNNVFADLYEKEYGGKI